jgi:hypothetical protein
LRQPQSLAAHRAIGKQSVGQVAALLLPVGISFPRSADQRSDADGERGKAKVRRRSTEWPNPPKAALSETALGAISGFQRILRQLNVFASKGMCQMLIVDGQIHLWEKGTPSPQHRQESYSAEQAIVAMDQDLSWPRGVVRTHPTGAAHP